MNTSKRVRSGDNLLIVGGLQTIFGYAGTFADKIWAVLLVAGIIIFMIGTYLQSSKSLPKRK